MSPKGKLLSLVGAALFGAALLGGCGEDKGSGVRLDPNVKPPKPFEQMTKQEKIDATNKLPMPDDAKKKRIADIEAGRG